MKAKDIMKLGTMITLDNYQDAVMGTDLQINNGEIISKSFMLKIYGLFDESGEAIGKIKKIIRDKDSFLSDEDRYAVMLELGDIMWYLATFAGFFCIKLSEIMINSILGANEILMSWGILTADEYQQATKYFNNEDGNEIVSKYFLSISLKLIHAIGAIAYEINHLINEEKYHVSKINKSRLIIDMGFLMFNLTKIANHLNIKLSDIMIYNIDKVTDRAIRGVVAGSGDNR